MNLNMIQSKKESEGLLLSVTRNCETPFNQTHTKAHETLEYKFTKPKRTFYFNPPITIEGSWMLGITDFEAYNSISNKNTINEKFHFYAETFDDFLFLDLKDELEEIPSVSYNTPTHQQHEILGLRIVEAYRKLGLESQAPMVILYYYWVMLDLFLRLRKLSQNF